MNRNLKLMVQEALINLREIQAKEEGLDPGDSQGVVDSFGDSAHTQELIWALEEDTYSLRALGIVQAEPNPEKNSE